MNYFGKRFTYLPSCNIRYT